MGLFDFGRKQENTEAVKQEESQPVVFQRPQALEVKSLTNVGGYESLINFMHDQGHTDLSAHLSFNLYKQTAPLFTAIKKITNELSSIRPVLYNSETKEFIHQHDILELLNQPNAVSRSRREFVRDLATNYLLTGNGYIWATGPGNLPALELFVAGSNTVQITNSKGDGYPSSMSVNTASGRIKFEREDSGRIFRYFWNKDGDSLGELFQIRDFNACTSDNRKSYGLSPLTPIYMEIEQYNYANKHNSGLLKRGATIGGILYNDGVPLDQEQEDRLKAEFDRYYSGAVNAGRPMVSSGKLKFENLMQSNKDMDWDKMHKAAANMIYSSLDIPLPLVNPDHMTLSNYDAARLAFYEDAVLPAFDLIMGEVFQMLQPRYKDLVGEKWSLTYDPNDIEALEIKRMEKLKKESDLGILKVDEQRQAVGREPVEGGDEIYIEKGKVPLSKEQERHDASVEERRIRQEEIANRRIGRSPDESPASARPNPAATEVEENPKMVEYFKDELKKQVDENGDPAFTDEEIEELANKWLELK